MQARRPARYSDSGWADDPSSDSVSELLRIHWLRVIVDEGHSLGSLNITNAGAFFLLHSWHPIRASSSSQVYSCQSPFSFLLSMLLMVFFLGYRLSLRVSSLTLPPSHPLPL